MFSFTNRRVLVTGAAKGIGAAIAIAFAERGADVVAADIDPNVADAFRSTTNVKISITDVTQQDQVDELFEKSGPFDTVINNVGVDQHAFFTETTAAEWRSLLAVNLESLFITTHSALPQMQRWKFGRIINISSEAGRLGSKGGAVYAAAKGGVIAFTKSIARENARYGITANVVAPGPIDTPLLRTAVSAKGERLLQAMTDATLLGRLGTPEEVAAAVLFLASSEASYITGETLGVSGGMGVG